MKGRNLRYRFTATIIAVYALLGILTWFAFQTVTNKIVRSIGAKFAAKEALLEKSRMLSSIQSDLSLSLKMANSPMLQRWALDENNAELKGLALAELESFRSSFKGNSIFFIVHSSLHYYFSDGTDKDALEKPSYTLNAGNTNDQWYFRAMRDVDDYALNVDYDNHLDVTKVWFNVMIKDDGARKIGLCGSAIDISQFIDKIVNSTDKGIQTILISADGAIEGHRNKEHVLRNSRVRGTQKKMTVYDLMANPADHDTLEQAIQALASGQDEVRMAHLTIEGKRYLTAMSHLQEIGWFNLVLVDPTLVTSNRDFLPILLVVIVSLFAIVVIIGLLLNRLVLSPLAALAESSRDIAQGRFDVAMPVRSEDEMGALTRSFNDMARMVKDHSENLENKVMERTEQLNQAGLQLAESNRQVMDSIRYAQLIQNSILPSVSEVAQCASRYFAFYRPRDIVGGDFHYFRLVEGRCVIGVIDCTGHGVPGAFMTMTAKTILDHVLDSLGSNDPAAVLAALNQRLRLALHRNGSDASIDNGLEIGLCSCDPAGGQLIFAGARIGLNQVAGGAITTYAGDRQAIGYRKSNADFTYSNHFVTVHENAMFYLASDGILDQAGGSKGLGFGRERFNSLLLSLHQKTAEEQQAALEQALCQYQGDHPQRDDITVVGFAF